MRLNVYGIDMSYCMLFILKGLCVCVISHNAIEKCSVTLNRLISMSLCNVIGLSQDGLYYFDND